MVYISFYDSSIECIQTKRTLWGERIVSSAHQLLPDDVIVKGKIIDVETLAQIIRTLMNQAYPHAIFDTHLVVAIPDYSLLFERFAVPKDENIQDEMQRVLATAAAKGAHNPQDYENYYKILAQTDDSTLVFYTAIEKEILGSYDALAQQLNMELSFTSSRSFAAYEVLREMIHDAQTVVFVVIHAHTVEYMMLDSYGPVAYALHKKAHGEKPTGAIKSAIAALHDQKTITLAGVLLAGEGALEESTTDYATELNVPVQKLEDVMERILQTAKVRFDSGGVPLMLYTFPLGIYLGKRRNDAPDFTLETPYVPQSPVAAMPKEVFPVVEHRASRLPWVLFLAFLALGLAAGALVLWHGSSFSLSSLSLPPFMQPTPTPTITPTPTVAITPTPSLDPTLKRADLKLAVENGSGKTGFAKEISDALKKKGYTAITTANADRTDYDHTIVRVKAEKKGYSALLLADLKDQFPNMTEEPLDDKDSHDAVVILGK